MRWNLVIAGGLAMTACVGDRANVAPATLPPVSTSPVTTSPVTTSPVTTSPVTTLPVTTPSAATTSIAPLPATTSVCDAPASVDSASVDPVNVGEGQLSGLVGVDIRAGRHPCFERVVIEFDPGKAAHPPFPGYRVEYVAPRDLTFDPSGEPAKVDGKAVLVVTVGSWMPFENTGYSGPQRFRPTNVEHILELVQLQNFEGVTTWAVGLDAKLPFVVTTLDSPPRLVIDVRTL